MSLEVQARASPLGLGVFLGSKPGARAYQAAKHLVALNAAVLEAIHGPRRRLIVAMPPRHGKSRFTSVLTPAWFLGTYPDRDVLFATYAGKLARTFGRQTRRVLEETGRDTYEVELSEDSQAANEWRIEGHEGGMVSAGIGGDFTGRGGHLVLIDDPIKDAKQALSPGYLDSLWEWFLSVMEMRCEPGASVIVTATRWHAKDLTGRLLAEYGDEWDVLRLPAIAETKDPLGRKEGAALWPERFDEDELARKKRRVGGFWWAAEYQQRPSPREGLIVNPSWFRFWRAGQLPRMDATILSVDANLKETAGGSYAVIQAWGKVGADRYLLDQLRGRWGFEELLRQFAVMVKRWPQAGRKLIEPTAAGPAAIAMLRRRFTGVLEAPAPRGSKVARLRAVAPVFESRNVFVPAQDEAPWVKPYMESLRDFPNGDGNDEGDATSQALAHWETGEIATVETSAGERSRSKRRERLGGPLAERPRRPNMGRVNLWGADDPVVSRGRVSR